jgi:hypothetical protein
MDVTNLADSSTMNEADVTTGLSVTSYPTVMPNDNLALLDLPGQMSNFPGGGSTAGAFPGGAADPSGINSLYLTSSVNPTPTGDWMKTAASIAASAASGFTTFAKGSPSVATPRPLMPGSSIAKSTMYTGATNWLFIGGAVVVGVIAITWLARTA